MSQFNVPTKNEVSAKNQQIFDQLETQIGFVPNLYATFAYSDTALSTYLSLQNAPTSLSAQEKQIVNLVVSQINECTYCLAAHSELGKRVGFTEDQILEIRNGKAPFNEKYEALINFVREVTLNHGHIQDSTSSKLLEVGYSHGNLVDIIIQIGDKIISNYLHNVTEVPVDFPAAPSLKVYA